MTPGEMLAQRRKSTGMTQARLGHLCGVGGAHISKIERGREFPSESLAQSIELSLGPIWRFCSGCQRYDFAERADGGAA